MAPQCNSSHRGLPLSLGASCFLPQDQLIESHAEQSLLLLLYCSILCVFFMAFSNLENPLAHLCAFIVFLLLTSKFSSHEGKDVVYLIYYNIFNTYLPGTRAEAQINIC